MATSSIDLHYIPGIVMTDLNDILNATTGVDIISYNSSTLNSPYKSNTTTAAEGLILSKQNDSYATQLAIGEGDPELYVRTKSPSGWTSWIKKQSSSNIEGNYLIKSKNTSINVSKYESNTHEYLFLVALRGWVATTTGQSLYLCSGITGGNNPSAVALATGATSPTITYSNHTISITFYNASGGCYSIIPLTT